MTSLAGGSQRTAQWSVAKAIAAGVVVAGLVGMAVVAAMREMSPQKQEQVAASSAFGVSSRPALTAAEDAYSHALWPIHEEVKQNAVRMLFAGLAYKTGDIKARTFREKVQLLVIAFDKSLGEASKLKAPDALKELHAQYLEAIKLYRDSSRGMVRAVSDKREQDLLVAQEMSAKAATLILKVGEELWPGEYKPN